MDRDGSRGFTLPELLVTGVVILALVFVAIFIGRPHDYGPEQRNAERWTAVAQHMQALSKYASAEGALPALPAQPQLVGSEENMLNLCALLVPKYAKDLSYDPAESLLVSAADCSHPEAAYTTGFTIARSADNKVTIAAPAAENHVTISLTKQF